MVLFKLMHDCAGRFTVVLGQLAVLCLLQNDIGWSVTGLVIFDFVMTPLWNELFHEQEVFLLHDSTSSPESNLGNIWWDDKSDGMRKILVGLHTPTWIPLQTCALVRLQLPPQQNWQNVLGNLQGSLGDKNFKGDHGQISVFNLKEGSQIKYLGLTWLGTI